MKETKLDRHIHDEVDEWLIDWTGLIIAIVKKKDLDSDDFADCWENDYDWTELDKFVIKNYRELLIDYGQVEADRLNFKFSVKELNKDLDIYIKENLE